MAWFLLAEPGIVWFTMTWLWATTRGHFSCPEEILGAKVRRVRPNTFTPDELRAFNTIYHLSLLDSDLKAITLESRHLLSSSG